MTFRPYPNPDRARHQLDRHTRAPRTVDGLAALRSWSVSSPEAARNLSQKMGAVGDLLRSVQPDGARAMANIAAALSRTPTVASLRTAPRPGSGA